MPHHRFDVGSIVLLQGERQATPQLRYIVEAQMPPVGTLLQYRIKNESEGFRRVVVEHQLSSLQATEAATPNHEGRSLRGEED